MEFLRSLLRRRFARAQVATSRNVEITIASLFNADDFVIWLLMFWHFLGHVFDILKLTGCYLGTVCHCSQSTLRRYHTL